MTRSLFVLSAVACCLSLLGSAALLHQNSVRQFGTLTGLPDPALDPRPQSIVGVNVALEQYDAAGLERALDALAGFAWLRQTFPWDALEPERGAYAWDAWDRVVAAAASRDKQLIAVLNYSPAWARDAGVDRSAPPRLAADFAAFAAALARRYAPVIDVYQIWDEPNLLLGWGGREPSAAGYAALLQAAHAAIHAADPSATVVAAALAPTTETGPDNVSDVLYLEQLYDLGAGPYFDAAAGKPYGFSTSPDDRLAHASVLNFSRFALLRQVMVRRGDGHKLLWAGNFGWNTLASPWGHVTPDEQAQHTLAAYQRAAAEWPWAGVLALESYQPAAPADDPRWGFALADPAGRLGALGEQINARYAQAPYADVGNFPAAQGAAQFYGAWEFSDLGADIPEDYAGARIEIPFRGTDLALTVRRGDYRGYLYVTVDGQPANQLPRDERGAYLVLTSPDLRPQVTRIPVASGLSANQTHRAVIVPERGWDQWAFAGYSVGRLVPDRAYSLALGGLAGLGAMGVIGLWRSRRALPWPGLQRRARAWWDRLGTGGQWAVAAVAGGLLYLSTWLTWGDELSHVSRRFGDSLPIVVTAATAGLFYFSPSLIAAILSIVVLFALFYLRLDLALAFTALFIPFYLQPRVLWQRGFSLVEMTTLMALGAWLLHNLRPWLARLRQARALRPRRPSARTAADWAVGAFLIVATLSLFTAEIKGVALREYRLAIVEPVLYYFLLRATPLDRPALWRVVDLLLLGAVIIAGIGLYQYASGTNLITAEGGVARIRSVYGSPNNLALYLGRALPIAVAVALLGSHRLRRVLYGLAALVLAATIALTFSKGALILGVPAALALVLIGWLGRRGVLVVLAGAGASLVSVPLLSRLPRFAGLLDPEAGTSFFRLKLWTSAWRMFVDHPILGVGLDNFLYQYRSRYILPEAWQEPNLSHPHNFALDHLTRLGLLGLAGGVWLQVSFWRTALAAFRRLSHRAAHASDPARRDLIALCLGLMASVADMLAHGLVDHSFFLVDLAFVFMLTLALVHHLLRLADEAPQRAPGGMRHAAPESV